MTRAWTWWVARTERPIDARILALVRVLVCACVVLDLLRVAQLGLVQDFYRLYADGGINAHPDTATRVIDWLGEDGGITTYWTTLAALTLAGLGIATRPMLLLGALSYAQLGHLYSPGDRGIDRILRTVLVILAFSGAHRRFALGLTRFAGQRRDRVPGWSADLLRWLMVMIYLSAGIAKLMDEPTWLGTARLPVVYRIMTDPMAAQADPVALESWWLLWVICGWATVLVELSSPLLLSRRFARWWSLAAIPMHLGIAWVMDLGMFSYGMLSLHVLLLHPWLLPLLDRVPWLATPALSQPGSGPSDEPADAAGPARTSGPTAPG